MRFKSLERLTVCVAWTAHGQNPARERSAFVSKATAVNPVDYKLRQGQFGGILPMVLGHDLAGVIDAIGPTDGEQPPETDFKVGDEVWCYLGGPKSNGTYAQWVCVPRQFVGHKPAECLSFFTEAAAVPLAGLTAYEAGTL